MKHIMQLLILFIPFLELRAQTIIVDHNSVADFDRIPEIYKTEAARLRMLYMDRSVGGNIDSYLDCLATPWASARSYCKRTDHRDSIYNVDPSEVYWNGVWDRSNWRYEYWPNGCSEDVQCFIDFIELRIDSFDVLGCQFSYLAVTPGSKIADPITGFFGSNPGKNHANVYAAFAAKYPTKKIIWWTTSLARGIGTPESQSFNDQLRNYAATQDIVLFDVADILSHDPSGNPCYDNRDGIEYHGENNPDDGLSIPAICPHYTTETEGGHLGSVSAGGVRVAKAFWVLMAKIAGWQDVVGVSTISSETEIELFPNPTNGKIELHLSNDNSPDDIHISVFNSSGLVCINQKISNHEIPENGIVTIPVHSLSPGVYLLTINNSVITRSIKFILLP